MAEMKEYVVFRRLLRVAIGENRTQREFAENAGISEYYISKMLNNEKIHKPSNATLRAIAEASKGRVTIEQLEISCSDEVAKDVQEDKDEDLSGNPSLRVLRLIQNTNGEHAEKLIYGISQFAGHATTYNNLHDFLDITTMLYSSVNVQFSLEESSDYVGGGHKGAERYVNVTATWSDTDTRSELGFVLYYCETKMGKIIVSDAAFDLKSLMDANHPLSGKALLALSEQKDADISNEKMVYNCYVTNKELLENHEAVKRLLKAIFNE